MSKLSFNPNMFCTVTLITSLGQSNVYFGKGLLILGTPLRPPLVILHKLELIHCTVCNLVNVNEASAYITYGYLIKAHALQPLCFSYGAMIRAYCFLTCDFPNKSIFSSLEAPTSNLTHLPSSCNSPNSQNVSLN